MIIINRGKKGFILFLMHEKGMGPALSGSRVPRRGVVGSVILV